MKRFGCTAPPSNHREGGWLSLLALLLTVAIIAILAVYLLRGPAGMQQSGLAGETGGNGQGIVAARDKAKDVVCRNNLEQLRLALQMAGSDDEGNRPATLSELAQNNPDLALNCPVGGEPYQYDLSTGRIWCIHPGHEKF